jgi:HAD superfamily hydrolase (TIGR01549 family)
MSTAILFDIDGTLVDSTYHHALAWHRAFRRYDVPAPMWRVHRAIGMGGDKLVAHVAGDDVEHDRGDDLRSAWEEEYAELIDEVPVLSGATDLVKQLAAAGHTVALASSGAERFSKVAVELLGIGDDIAAMTNSDDAEDSKPDPDILGATLDRLGAVEAAVFLGDTPYDVEAAERLGLGCVAVLTGGFSRAELERAGAALVVEDLTELTGLDWSAYLRKPEQT